VCVRPVGQIDLVPTFLALAGVRAPWPLHGHDLSPLLRNPAAAWPHPVMIEYFNEEFGADSAEPTPEKTKRAQPWEPPGWWISLRQDRFSYIRWLVPDEIEELYDLERDPRQLINLAVEPRHRRTLEDFRARAEAELRRTNAEIVERLPPVRTAFKS
jgi:arylsulfatase A-like enzyme